MYKLKLNVQIGYIWEVSHGWAEAQKIKARQVREEFKDLRRTDENFTISVDCKINGSVEVNIELDSNSRKELNDKLVVIKNKLKNFRLSNPEIWIRVPYEQEQILRTEI